MKKNLIAFSVVMFLALFSCQEDESIRSDTNTTQIKNLNVWRFPVEKILKHNPEVKNRVEKLKSKKLQARMTSSIYDFSIEETDAQVIFGDNYTQYTFKIERENTVANLLENYICKIYNDGEVFQYLVSYPFTETPDGTVYDGKNSVIQEIQDSNILINAAGKGFPPGCVPELISETWQYLCTSIPCSGNNHGYEDTNCDCGVTADCTPATQECGWVGTFAYGCGGGSLGGTSPGGDGGLSPGTGGGGSNPTQPTDPVVTVPFENKNHIKNCDELNSNSQDETFKDRMETLKANVNGNKEKSFGIYNGSYETPALPNPSCGVVIEGNEQQGGSVLYHISLKAIAHNHLKDPVYNHIGTFSPNDLIALSNLVIDAEEQSSPLKQQEFASYLVCEEGNYALKVSNGDKLLNFVFMYANNTSFKDDVDDFYKEQNIVHGKEKKDQNIGFLKLMKEFDIGIDYYEADESFQNWEKLELNSSNNDIVKKPC